MRRRLDVRRTASWSTSDAFTDGHMAEGAEQMMPGLRTKAATSRAHAFRRYHHGAMGRSSSDAQSRSFDVRAPICRNSNPHACMQNAAIIEQHPLEDVCAAIEL